MEEQLRRDALEYHRVPTFGKISVTPTKSLVNQRDLALAYSPGVAYACLAIQDDPNEAATLTSRANLVAVITNGSPYSAWEYRCAGRQASDGGQGLVCSRNLPASMCSTSR